MKIKIDKKDEGINILDTILLIIAVTVLLTTTIVYFTRSSSLPIYNNEQDLNLSVSLSTSSLNKDEGLNITVNLFNKAPYSLTANLSSNWPYFQGIKNRMTMYPCAGNLPFGFVVLEGYYDLATYSQGQPLLIYKPGIYACPVQYAVSSYVFLPLSDHALLIGSSNPPINMKMQGTAYVNGSWTYSWNQYVFKNFSLGIYTVVAADEWGAVQIAYFTVH
ncbi:MAG: hypothetical protein QXZ12_04375 [Thermoplasmata archaeon]